MSGIFISYRREDSAGHAGRLFDRLQERFGKDHVFMDVAGIEPGVDFVEAIDSAVGSCDALIVVIGRKWLTCTDAAGKRRLDDPKDFIRLETATALRRGIRVIPVLIQDTAMPTEKDLPEDIKTLARRQGIEISDGHWNSDTEALIETLAKVLPGEAQPSPPEKPAETPHITPVQPKNRLVWLISTITAVVVALGGLLSTIDSVKNTFSGLFSSQSEKRIETTAPSPAETSPPQVSVVVPNLIGIPLDAAVAQLRQQRLQPGAVRSRPEDRSPGTVVEQEPTAGSRLDPGSKVHLVVAENPAEPEKRPEPKPEPETVAVPKLVGLSQENARAALKKAGLVMGKVRQVESREAKPGTVIEQAPPAGRPLAKGSAVTLVVALEPPAPVLLTVPNLNGLTVEMARESLAREGLTGVVHEKASDLGRPGTVIDQRPKPGQQVQKGTTVEFLIATAPVEAKLVEVPKLTGLTLAMARESLAREGLKPGLLHKKVYDRASPGTVIDQKPGPGQPIKRGAAVDLVIAAASAGTEPAATGGKVTVIVQGEPTARRFWEGVKKPAYSAMMARLYSDILKESASAPIEMKIDTSSERDMRVLEKMLRDPKRLCESTGADIVLAARAQEAFASSSVESAYWPELRQTAIVCNSGRQFDQRNNLSPERIDKFPFEKTMAEAMQKFAREYRHLLK